MSLIAAFKKNPFVRKAHARLQGIPRYIKRTSSTRDEYFHTPPILVNSFPKSGTHLLLQAAGGVPGLVSYGAFIASMTSSMTFRERTAKNQIKLIKSIIPNEIVSAHLFYLPEYEAVLSSINCVHFFIYRDLRDVAISETHYLTDMNRWHRLYPYFKKLPDLNARISQAILGIEADDFPYDYPNIAKRFQRYAGWLDVENVYAIKFEDLVGEKRHETIEQMMNFYARHVNHEVDVSALVKSALANIDPHKSHTFRVGQTSQWKSEFTSEHIHQMESVAGDLLRKLGYE